MIAFADGDVVARRWKSFENLTFLSATNSSNDLAREFIELYFEEDQKLPATVILTDAQPQARGRTGRWIAPAGRGLYLTIVLPIREREPLSLLPLAIARWTRDAIEEQTCVPARVKWPNDLYVQRRKIAGILAESRTQGENAYVAVGIGLNVRGLASDLGISTATTLEEEAGRPISLAALTQAILDRLDRELARPHWEAEAAKWEKVSVHRRGDSMTVRRNGTEVSGSYQGLTPEGFLRLKTASGEEVVTTGEVTQW